jgi:type VI protein secretion system component VasK
MSKTKPKLDPQRVAGARRRLGFVALLWWVSALFGSFGLAQGLHAGWVRLLFIGIAWVMAILFSYAWWEVRKNSPLQ